ncbi:MAG TPA: aspartate 1-decarboxylase [Thermoanaerobaculia bacterium]|nr:aspartate 1-decarboxylase [Thermoanaerobaculia bacterium]
MQRTMMKSKIHRATVTGADLHYQGSVAIDLDLLEAADLLANERVEIYNVTNGERFATYAIPAARGSGDVIINGAAAHKASKGDLVILASYANYEDQEARRHQPTVILVDEANRILEPALLSF